MNIKVGFLIFCSVLSLLFVSASSAQTRYVTDDFEIMLRTGPSVQNKIVKALKSGTRLEVLRLDAGNGHSQVQTSQGEIGYVLTRFLSQNESARNRVRYLEQQLKQLSSKPGELQTLLANSQAENQDLIQLNTSLTDQLQAATTELADIKKISGDSVNLAQRSRKLESEVQQLLLQLDDIRIQNEVLKDQSAKRWYVLGGGTVFIGLLLGWILSIAKRPRRQSWGA
ncbi:TIGR04211 family SH3 domain-containing protein [Arenicella xantha]|uniref:SH3 domain protein n=1 Tax=Arenicella xantha TaxID=644221 RepID=A0A395JNS3_9GAMM|nr:TIGR04211 family SH3 domain-containing protein [Arenicella xantha]RBP53310.1 SH3 domain protein [Arenicella xantha]